MSDLAPRPKWILHLLWFFKGESCYPQIEGDLSEEFQLRVSKNGIADARQWYRREVCRNFWSLTWRWETIAVIVLTLFFVALGFSTFPRMPIPFLHLARLLETVLKPLLPPVLGPQPFIYVSIRIVILMIPTTIIPGLSFPLVCGALLRGHQRMIRLVVTAYCLGITVLFGISRFDIIMRDLWQGVPHMFSPTVLVCSLPLWILPFIWVSSTWVERHQRRRAIA